MIKVVALFCILLSLYYQFPSMTSFTELGPPSDHFLELVDQYDKKNCGSKEGMEILSCKELKRSIIDSFASENVKGITGKF